MQNDSFKMRQHYAPYNRSEESHDLSGKYILRTFSVGYFAYAQYDVLFIPYRRRCRHFAYAADAPLLSLSRHFPRFSGGIYPEGGSEICLFVFAREAKRRSKLPGGRRSTEYKSRTFSVGYFAFAQYDEKEERSHSVKSNRSCRGRFFYAKNRRYANFI